MPKLRTVKLVALSLCITNWRLARNEEFYDKPKSQLMSSWRTYKLYAIV